MNLMEQAGSQLGAYRLQTCIGGGGFATVYAARDTRTNELVAIKVLHPHLAQNAQFIARFQREAQALRGIAPHPNIVRLRDVGQQNSTHFLVFEYLDGKDLSQILAERKQLPVDQTIAIVVQIAQALEVAHRHGLVHRDIKPSNVKITSQGAVKVLDFGIARPTEATTITQPGSFMGTPDYVAPEVWEGKNADIRSDIYALGIVFFQMLTGISPFHADTPIAVMRRHLMEAVPSARALRGDVPPNIERLLARMIAKRPADRYQTPRELLKAIQSGDSVVGAPLHRDAPTITVVKPQSRNNWALPVVAAIGAGVILLSVFLAIAGTRGAAMALASTATKTPELPTLTPRPTDIPPTSRPTQTLAPVSTPTPVVLIVTTTPSSSPTRTATARATPTPTPAPSAGTMRVVGGAPMLFVPAGEFTMGNNSGASNEQPTHTVFLGGFWIDKYEVSNRLYMTCEAGRPCRTAPPAPNWKGDYFTDSQLVNRPVINVLWDEANAYCAAVGKRLPTEAEWERAARGTDGRLYPWGDKWNAECAQYGWSPTRGHYQTYAEVDGYANCPSPVGALNMAGNVWEWVADWYDANYYRISPRDNPKGPSSGQARIIRGGSVLDQPAELRTTFRFSVPTTFQADNVGFRCAQ
jgi:serine/threonine-protein kinase